MNSKNINPIQPTPVVIWIIRIFFLGIGLFVSKYLVMSMAIGPLTGRLTLGVFLLLNIIAVIASYIRSKTSLIIFTGCILTVPLTLFIPIDILMIKGSWYEQCLAWTIALLEQLLIPISIVYYIWKAPRVRSYYIKEISQ